MSGTVRRVEVFPANGRIVLGPGNLLFILDATANVTVTFERGGTTFGAIDVSAGYVKRNITEWERAVLTGTAAATVEFFYGTELIAEDDTDFRQTIATIAGVTTVAEQPSSALATGADVAVAAGATSDIAANLGRKRLLVGADVANADPLPLRVRNTAAATAQGAQLQAGQSIKLPTTAAVRVMNPGAVAQTYWFLEES